MRLPNTGQEACALEARGGTTFHPKWPLGRALAVRRTDVVRVALFASCLGVVVWYVFCAARVDGNNDNDAAYYLGVARHMARTGRFEENIVWHFLTRPASVLHRPFDYWQGLTSLVLLPALALSRDPHAPFVTMGLISGSTLLLLWYMVTRAAPLRHPLAQAAVLFVFAFSPAMLTYRFDTDTVPLMQLLLVASLVALARSRLKTAACIAFLMVWTRGDGAIHCAIVWAACLFEAKRANAEHATSNVKFILGTFVALGLVYVTGCLLMFGKVPPPAMRVAPRLKYFFDLNAFERAPKLARWHERFRFDAVAGAFWTALTHLRNTPFSSRHEAWIVFVLAVGWRKLRWSMTRTTWALLFLGSGIILFASGVLFSQWRTLYTMLPVFALTLGAALDDVLDSIRRWRSAQRGAYRDTSYAAVALFCLLVVMMVAKIPTFVLPRTLLASLERDLRALSPTLQGETVASVRPWSVIATTDSPAIMIPVDGEQAFADALKLYDVRWLILSNESCQDTTEEICAQIRAGTRAEVGPFRIEERTGAGDLRLFRIEKPM